MEYATPNFSPAPWKLQSNFRTPDGKQGIVEIVYLEKRPDEVEDPFLIEERSVIDSLAEMLMSYLERKEAQGRVAQVSRELVERNEELWRLQKEMGRVEPLAALGRITGMIAHELGTPLNSVLGYSQLLAEEELTEIGRRRVKTIEAQTQRMADIVQYYLSRTRGLPVKHSQIDVNDLVKETVALLKPVFERQGVQVILVLAELLRPLYGHSASLQRLLINLLNNAVDALKDGGTVTVASKVSRPPELKREVIVVEVTDTGVGIPADILPKVFDLFVTTKEPGKGTGIGLAICQEIAKAHGAL
jgi:signal transduction histidine kinase